MVICFFILARWSWTTTHWQPYTRILTWTLTSKSVKYVNLFAPTCAFMRVYGKECWYLYLPMWTVCKIFQPVYSRMEALVAILLVGGWGQVSERPPKTCARWNADWGLFTLFFWLYHSNHLFSDWPLGDCTSVFNTCSRQRVISGWYILVESESFLSS